MIFEGVVELGGLYKVEQPLPLPSRPWLVDQSAVKPYEGLADGDIHSFTDLPDMTQWSLGDTPSVQTSRINWIVLRTDTSRLFISDRVLLVNVSWLDLVESGYVNGRDIVIDGQEYTCRLLDGGFEFLNPEDGYLGASNLENEWDKIVCNTSEIVGLPTPAPLDLGPNIDESVRLGEHNQLWNWVGVNTWTMRPYAGRSAARCCRGFAAANFFYLNTFDHRHEDIGWRPVLEQRLVKGNAV